MSVWDKIKDALTTDDADWRELARVNNIDNPDLVFPGQKIRTPK